MVCNNYSAFFVHPIYLGCVCVCVCPVIMPSLVDTKKRRVCRHPPKQTARSHDFVANCRLFVVIGFKSKQRERTCRPTGFFPFVFSFCFHPHRRTTTRSNPASYLCSERSDLCLVFFRRFLTAIQTRNLVLGLSNCCLVCRLLFLLTYFQCGLSALVIIDHILFYDIFFVRI